MSDFNRVILLGHIGNDLKLQKSGEGRSYLRVSLATNAPAKGEKARAHWHRVVLFGNLAEMCSRYLSKGSRVLVEGSLVNSSFPGKDGKKIKSVSVVAHDVRFLGGKMTSLSISDREAEDIIDAHTLP